MSRIRIAVACAFGLLMASAWVSPAHGIILTQTRKSDGNWINMKWTKAMPITIYIDQGSLWCAVQSVEEVSGDTAAQQELYYDTLETTYDILSGWSVVPYSAFRWAPYAVSSISHGIGDGKSDLWFDASAGGAGAQHNGDSYNNEKITETSVRIGYTYLTSDRLGGTMAQETGHGMCFGHSMVSYLFSPATDNASMSITANRPEDGILSPDDRAAAALLYPIYVDTNGDGMPDTTQQRKYTATVTGYVKTESGTVLNGGCVMAVRFNDGAAVVGRVSGVYSIPKGIYDIASQGNGSYNLVGLPDGKYLIVALPFRHYLSDGEIGRMNQSGFYKTYPDDDDADTDGEQSFAVLFTPGFRVLTVKAGTVCKNVNFDGACGDLDYSESLTWNDYNLAQYYYSLKVIGFSVPKSVENRMDFDQNGLTSADIATLKSILEDPELLNAVNASVFKAK